MSTFIVVDEKGVAYNFVAAEKQKDIPLPDKHQAIPHGGPWGPGWQWNGAELVDPDPPPTPEPPKSAPDAPTPGGGINTV